MVKDFPLELPQLPYRFPIDVASPHPFSVYDMVRVVRLSGLVPSPGGDRAVVVAETWDPATDRVTRNLWLVELDGSGCTPPDDGRRLQGRLTHVGS